MDNSESLEEKTNSFVEEVHDEAKFCKRFGIGAMILGAAMVAPLICAQKLGYDFQVPFNAYEWFAGVSAILAPLPLVWGSVCYLAGRMEHELENDD